MNLDEIKQYSHKIKTIEVTNDNKYSFYNNVLIKINIHSNSDEIVRFSLQPNDIFIDHQQIENDYYCYIPNNLNSKTLLYAHFFPAELYEYEMLDYLVSEFNLEELIDSATITSNGYHEEKFDNDGHLIIQSKDDTSVTYDYDPNYKQYDDIENLNNKTQKGKFPLSSKYRSKQNWKVPNLNDKNPQWEENNNEPYWQARIPFDGLQTPLNVFINYEYLPTSREYHQHYFGFEPEDMNNNNNQCKTINVFEGTNINMIDEKFGSENNYRLINLGNPYDDSRSIYVPHENIIPIDLNNFQEKYYSNTQSCTWGKHKCKKYYIYTPHNTPNDELGYCYQNIDLKKGKYYSLQYYVYIPSKATVDNDTCHIIIDVDGTEYKMNNAFIIKDKSLRDQWVYHEVPFLAGNKNIIKIIGPQGSQKEKDYEDSIFFIYIELREMVEYSPTLKYSETGLRITEQNKTTFKSLTHDTCIKTPITPDDKQYTTTVREFPTPSSGISVISKDEKYIYYDQYTTNLIYVTDNDDDAIDYVKEEGILYIEGNDDISFRYDDGVLYSDFSQKLTGIYGPNNMFIFDFVDSNGELINEGEVEVSILTQEDDNKENKGFMVTKHKMQVTGHMVFDNIDLTNLEPNTSIENATNKYHIRLIYENECTESKIFFKTLYVYEEQNKVSGIKINNENININTVNQKVEDYRITDISQFPLKIEVQITNQENAQTNGYCELSINDKLNQTTLMDTNCWADFYLRPDDLKIGKQTVKIEYYRQYNKSLAFIYFDIIIDSLDVIKNYVPIDIKILKNKFLQPIQPNDTFEIDDDDCVLMNINTNDHSKFRLEVYRNDVLIIKKNIFNKNTQDISFLHATLDEWKTHNQYTFKIVTGNMIDDNGNVIQDLYRDYERTYIIKKTVKLKTV